MSFLSSPYPVLPQKMSIESSLSPVPSFWGGIYLYSYKLVRGASDLGGVANRVTARSRYGGKRPMYFFFGFFRFEYESRKNI